MHMCVLVTWLREKAWSFLQSHAIIYQGVRSQGQLQSNRQHICYQEKEDGGMERTAPIIMRIYMLCNQGN